MKRDTKEKALNTETQKAIEHHDINMNISQYRFKRRIAWLDLTEQLGSCVNRWAYICKLCMLEQHQFVIS